LIIRFPIVFTSAGNPKTFTSLLKTAGINVVHVVSSSKFAQKAEAAGCDAVVAEGFEAGGHNGKEETTSFVLIPAVKEKISIPVIAAGGIATGRQMFAVMVLGASAVQIDSRFIASNEASCHLNFKEAVISLQEGDTELCLKKLTPVRLLKNNFYNQVKVAEESNIGVEELIQLLGTGRAKKGMFEGDMNDGELEIGQVCTLIQSIKPAEDVVNEIWNEYNVLLIGFRK
jgi:enoyl-[acyl-carrier protein] reductase II